VEVKTILKRIFMDLCSSNHDEIVYIGRRCPVCDLKEEVEKFEEENSTLKQRIEELENADLI
jgi:cell division protein FtsB